MLYKDRYSFAFYESDDETYFCGFDNIYQMLKFKGLEATPHNVNIIRSALSKALKRPNHYTTIFGRPMRVYLIDLYDDDDKYEF